MALVRASGLDWTILSPSLLFGPRDGFFNILAGLVRLSPGVTPITGRGEARFQPLAIEDLARIVVRVLADPATTGTEYLLGGPRTWTYREIMGEVLRGMGTRRAMHGHTHRRRDGKPDANRLCARLRPRSCRALPPLSRRVVPQR